MKYPNSLAFIVVFSCSCLLAQTGVPPFASVQTGDFDSVNLQDLNANFVVPIISHPGRGLAFQYQLAYNSLVFAKVTSASTVSWGFLGGWTTDGPVGSVSDTRVQINVCLQFPSLVGTENYVFTDPLGTAHPFPVQQFSANNCGFTNVWTGYATDVSGYFMDITGSAPIVRGPDGTKYDFSTVFNNDANGNPVSERNAIITDPNGNQITSITQIQNGGTPNFTIGETDWFDTLGQVALKINSVFNASSQLTEKDYSRLAVDGSYQTIAVKYEYPTLQTNFGCSGITELSTTNTGLVSEIDLPNGQKYSFTYEPTPGNPSAVTGRMQQITLPTGGTIDYQYTGPNDGINCADGTLLGLTRTVSTNTATDGSTPAVWTYVRTGVSGVAGTTTVTAPKLSYDQAPNQTAITFDSNGRETTRQIYQGSASGAPVRTIKSTWAPNKTPASRTVILEDGATQSEVETNYDPNGNLLTSKEHDLGQGAPGQVLRTATLSYLTGSSYTAANIINRLQDETVQDSGNVVKFRLHVDYDQLGAAGQGKINAACPANPAAHDTSFDCSYTTRGLPTTVTNYTDAAMPAGAITRSFNYDSLGNLITSLVNSVQQKQSNFSSATQYAFPDSVISGPPSGSQVTTSATYYLTTGEVKTSTDANGQVTTYSYADPGHLDRLTDVQRPDLAHLTTTYDDLGLTISSTSPVQGTDILKNVTAVDGLGRPITKKVEDAGGNVDSAVSTQYDVLGRAYKTSSPYTSSPQFFTTNQFDTLGRPTLTIAPDGAQASTSYNLNSTTVTDPVGAPRQRKSITDGLGQVAEVDEPGDSFSGSQAQGSITIGGTLSSKPGTSGTPGIGTVTINGFELQKTTNPCQVTHQNCPVTIYDSGNISVTVNGVKTTTPYGQGKNNISLAGDLAQAVNQNTSAPVTATSSGNVVTLQAKTNGSGTNYSLSAAASTSNPSTFPAGSFSTSVSGATLTGGTDGASPVNDSGTIVLKLGSFTTAPVCYGTSCNSTAAQIASALAGALNVPGSPVQNNVQVSGSTLSMTYTPVGTIGNVALSAVPTSGDPADFPNGSFASQGALSGGADPYSSTLAHPYVTTYQYGVFGNLLQVTQGVQTRSYGYDGMGRMTDVTTPEAGHVNLQYNALDQVTTRTDARNVVTNYSYTTLNQLREIDYVVGTTGVPATPSVVYNYGTSPAQNNNGRITTITDGLGSENYTYDQLGRVSQLQKVINGATYTIGYRYNLAGELTSLTYPSGRVVKQSFDGIGRLCEVAPDTTGCGTSTAPYAKTFGYNAALQNTGFTYGNGLAAAFTFSPDRLQLTNLSYVKGTQTLFGLNYFYKQDATNCRTGAASDNGQLQCIIDAVDAGRNVSYTYDTLGRLSSAQTQGSAAYPQWGLSFSMDRYGNVTSQTTTAGSASQFSVLVNAANNQIGTLSYDPNGNMLNDGRNALVYDAANRTTSSTSGGATSTYSYDCKNLRVVKVSSGVTTVYIYSNDGRVLAEYDNGAAPTAPTREYIYSGNTMLAQITGGATTYFMRDHLSNRVLADTGGNTVGQMGHFPYGQSWYDSNLTKWKFTTYERDSESQNDYALARYYINLSDRFSSPDPMIGSAGNPQSWNRYAYAGDDPINSSDPTGQFVVGWERSPRYHDLFLSAAALAAGEGALCAISDDPESCPPSGFETIIGGALNSPGNVAIGSLEGTIHNILSEVLNIDTCPGGTFECPSNGAPLFGIPTCDPRFCISDVQDNNNLAPDQQDDCAREALLSAGVAFLSEFIPTGGIIDPRSGPVAAAVAALSEWKEIITNPVIAGRVAKVLTPIVGEVAGETFIPVLGEAILTAQVLHGLYEATGAYTEGLDTCTAKYSGK